MTFACCLCFCASAHVAKDLEKVIYTNNSSNFTILTSSSTVALITSIIAGDDFTIDMLHTGQGCPHHYSGKPSDRRKLQNADAVIYIDDKFEAFFASMIENSTIPKYRISSNFDVIKSGGSNKHVNTNWHFWNNPNQVYKAIEDIGYFMISLKPESKQRILARIADSKEKLALLGHNLKTAINQAESIMLISRSVEPLFYDTEYEAKFSGDYLGLKFVQDLSLIIKQQPDICIISDTHDNHHDVLKKYNAKHVTINGENISWSSDADLMQQYIDYINNIIQNINSCNQ